MTKVTKRERYAALAAILVEAKNAGIDADFAGLTEFVNHEVELLDKKAEKAKANAKKNNAATDALADAVKDVLTDEPATIADITAAVDDETATAAKVGYRLRALVEQGVAVKEEVTVAGGEGQKSRKLAAYRLAD